MNFNIDYKKLSDPLYIAKELIRFPSETPKDEGALLFVEEVLTLLGFECYRMPSGDVDGVGKDALYEEAVKSVGFNYTGFFHMPMPAQPFGWY